MNNSETLADVLDILYGLRSLFHFIVSIKPLGMCPFTSTVNTAFGVFRPFIYRCYIQFLICIQFLISTKEVGLTIFFAVVL